MNLKAVLEGLLFVVGDEGISKERLVKILGISDDELQRILNEYSADLENDDRGIRLEEYNDNYKYFILT